MHQLDMKDFDFLYQSKYFKDVIKSILRIASLITFEHSCIETDLYSFISITNQSIVGYLVNVLYFRNTEI